MKFDTLIFTDHKIDDIATNAISASMIVMGLAWLVKNAVASGWFWKGADQIDTINKMHDIVSGK